MPKVSVVLPTYNAEAYIQETLQSIFAQTFTDFEVIVVDDGSRDRSIEIAQSFQDARLRIVQQANRGLAGARNTGIRHAQGEYIALLDADDLWLPEKLQRHVYHLDYSPTVGVSFSRSSFINQESQPVGLHQMPKLNGIRPEDVFCRNPIGNGSAAVIRRQVFAEIQFEESWYGEPESFFFDDRFRQSEDIECWVRIVLQTKWQIEGLPEALTLYRVNDGGLSANVWNQLESWENMVEKTRTYAPNFVTRWENRARAYQLRYLCRRAVRSGDRATAWRFLHRAIGLHPAMLWEEPSRTVMTIAAVYVLTLVPQSLYQRVEAWALQFTGASQQREIARQSASVSSLPT